MIAADEGTRADPLVSIIVPVWNGAELVVTCQSKISTVVDELIGGAEVVYVDDGSRDGTLAALQRLQAGDARIRIVELAGNFGQHAALLAGIERARGQHLVTLDVDLQCDPRDIPAVLAPLGQGCDLVCGVRANMPF
jgi:glycosyltransferase involved in cell wall biosynthesis